MKKTGFYAITAAAVLSAAGAAPLSSQAAQDPYLAAPGRVAAVFSVPAPAVGTLPGLSGLIRFPICTEKPSIPQAPEWPDTPLIPEQPDAPQSPELPDAPENNGSPETDGGVQEPGAETPAAQVLALVNAQRARAGLGSFPWIRKPQKPQESAPGDPDLLFPYPARWKRLLHRPLGSRGFLPRLRGKHRLWPEIGRAGHGRLDEQRRPQGQYLKSRILAVGTAM